MQRPLPCLLGAVRTLSIRRFDNMTFDVGRVGKGRDSVIEKARSGVHAVVIGVDDMLLHDRLGEAHVHAAFHLALDDERRECGAAIVGDPDLCNVDDAGLGIDDNFGNVSGKAVRR